MSDKEKYSFSYSIESKFEPAISRHFFKLRMLPWECSFQHVVEKRLVITPDCVMTEATDGFGNKVQYGGFSMPHSRFCVESSGIVECSEYRIPGKPEDIYLAATPLTEWNDEIMLLGANGEAADIMHRVHRHLTYERFVTDNTTSAIEAFRIGKGVCQDFAHLMIAVCRSQGLHARYVNGLTLGEGETHAWVEVNDGMQWLGYDPTLDRVITHSYIKFAHGRDVADCPSNRGRFYGWTSEVMSIHCRMHEI